MRQKINQETKTMLEVLKNKILLYGDRVFVISNFDIEETSEDAGSTIFGKKRPNKTAFYVSNLHFTAYDNKGKFIGIVDEEHAVSLITMYDLYQWRKSWDEFVEQLNAFGLIVTKEQKSE